MEDAQGDCLLAQMLYVALLLFSSGLVEWLFHINPIITIAMFLGLGGWAIFYVVTYSISFVSPNSLYRTPLVRIISILVERIKENIRLFKREREREPRLRASLYLVLTRPGTRAEGLDAGDDAALVKDENVRLSIIVWLLKMIDPSVNSQLEYLSVLKTMISPHMDILDSLTTAYSPPLSDIKRTDLLVHIVQRLTVFSWFLTPFISQGNLEWLAT